MSTHIDHTNYEAYLLDRMEGNLSPAQERELEAFLVMNPDLVPDDQELPSLTDTTASLSKFDKAALKRTLPPNGMPGETPLDDLLIARLEGDLSPAQLHALKAYLLAHTEHQRAERTYALTKLGPEAMAFAAKEELSRALPPVGMPTLYTAEDFMIARAEGDLDPQQEEAIGKLIDSDLALARFWELVQRTRVQPVPMVYPHKGALKKGAKVIAIGTVRWRMALAVAASVAVLLGVSFWMLREGPQRIPQVAETVQKSSNPNSAPAKLGHEIPKELVTDPEQPVVENGVVPDQKNGVTELAPIDPQHNGPNVPAQKKNDAPNVRPIQRDETLLFAEQKVVVPSVKTDRPTPENVEVAVVPAYSEAVDEVAMAAADPKTISVGGLFASTVRERVLDQTNATTEPLGLSDAVAAVDKGLKVIAGGNAGLTIEKTGDRRRTFDLRLGRNLSITAGR